ncbi:MAG: hypothetical protein K0S30_2125, partial [Clostridia bacterium]|nr:hypothetical protein [Clostridia bacterium]
MTQAWLVYHKEDYIKNIYFANKLMDYAANHSINLQLVLREDITLGIQKNKLLIKAETIQTQPQLVINRS